ncbi:MAG: hypothetical protein V1735_06325 [Nanoarchaeota archaeon]
MRVRKQKVIRMAKVDLRLPEQRQKALTASEWWTLLIGDTFSAGRRRLNISVMFALFAGATYVFCLKAQGMMLSGVTDPALIAQAQVAVWSAFIVCMGILVGFFMLCHLLIDITTRGDQHGKR